MELFSRLFKIESLWRTERMSSKKYLFSAVVFFLLIGFVAGCGQDSESTVPEITPTVPPAIEPPADPETLVVNNEECLSCHQAPDMFLPLPSGEQLYLTIDAEGFASSVHGEKGYACVQCHTEFTGYPHPDFSAEDRRDVSIQLNQACLTCHASQADLYVKGRHSQEFAKGNLNTALCVDCHSSHQVHTIQGSKVEIATVCQKCHSEIYDIYKNSVHGEALLDDDNFDVPTCSDCHENHDNTGPGDQGFKLFSPNICENCHADQELMADYGINTNVFETYVADFHGTTVTIFENITPDQETNKPVCIDCHGVHDIHPPTDENSSVIKQNLLGTCQRCHPDASSDFSDSWMSHYIPDMENNTPVYLVNLLYYVLIPGTVSGLLLYIFTDVWRNYKNKREGEK
jgi:nitrate reductase cytochrome c-type subunit